MSNIKSCKIVPGSTQKIREVYRPYGLEGGRVPPGWVSIAVATGPNGAKTFAVGHALSRAEAESEAMKLAKAKLLKLVRMGAKSDQEGHRMLKVRGVRSLRGHAPKKSN